MSGRNNYRAALRSPHWRRLRRRKRPKICAICEATDDLELHHLTYERLGRERLEDVVWLCGSCHGSLHKLVEAREASLDPSSALDPARRRPFVPPPRPPRDRSLEFSRRREAAPDDWPDLLRESDVRKYGRGLAVRSAKERAIERRRRRTTSRR